MLDLLILQKNIQKELKKLTKKIAENLIMMKLSFLCKKKNICINVFGYGNGLVFPIYVSKQKF